jgi:hypothetical protein
MSLCLSGGGAMVALAWTAFTLSWTHSVEKIRWEEDWRVSASGMRVIEARVKGTGAGMEPPADARLHDGWWRYTPRLPDLPRLVLARSGAVADWRLCQNGDCATIGAMLGTNAATVTLAPCGRP